MAVSMDGIPYLYTSAGATQRCGFSHNSGEASRGHPKTRAPSHVLGRGAPLRWFLGGAVAECRGFDPLQSRPFL